MRTLATLIAGAALSMVVVMGPSASASVTSPLHQMKPTGMAWQLVQPDTARAYHVSPRSVVLSGALHNGQRSTMVITPNLRIAFSNTAQLPAWLHIHKTSVKHNGHPCVIVDGGNGDTSALVCSDGYASTSKQSW